MDSNFPDYLFNFRPQLIDCSLRVIGFLAFDRCAVHEGLSAGAEHPSVYGGGWDAGRRPIVLDSLLAGPLEAARGLVRARLPHTHNTQESRLGSPLVLPSRLVHTW